MFDLFGPQYHNVPLIIDALRHVEPLPSLALSNRPGMTGHRNNGASRFDPLLKLHTGKPHEHRREIARRLSKSA